MAQERSGLMPSTGSLGRAVSLVGALLWAALLYYLSDQPTLVDIQAFEYQDKALHLFAYGVLGMLIMGALRAGSNGYRVSQVLLVTILAGLYGLLDEYHQSFVPGRDPDFSSDGWIVYSAPFRRSWKLYRLRPDGSARAPVGRELLEEEQPAVSPDGKLVLYVAETEHRADLYLRRMDGSGDRILFQNGDATFPTW